MEMTSIRPCQARGFTILEIVLAMFILSFGLFGVMALFPVGLDNSRRNLEGTNASLIADSAGAYLNMAPELRTRFPAYDAAVASVTRTGTCGMNAGGSLVCTPEDGTTWANGIWNDHMLLLLSGRYAGKVFRITVSAANIVTIENGTGEAQAFDTTGDGSGAYFIKDDTSFIVLGPADSPATATDALIPGDLFDATLAVPATMPGMITGPDGTGGNTDILAFMKSFSISAEREVGESTVTNEFHVNYEDRDADDDDRFVEPSEYTWACLLADLTHDGAATTQAYLLIYRNYNPERRPDFARQRPPVKIIPTFVSVPR